MSGKTVTRVNRGTDAGEGVINLIAGIHLMDELENMMNKYIVYTNIRLFLLSGIAERFVILNTYLVSNFFF